MSVERAGGVLGSASTELVAMSSTSAFRWFEHEYPHPLARWHFHEELEIHVITGSSGVGYIGESIVPFRPGAAYLIGPWVPHHWVSSIPKDRVVDGRDLLVQFRPHLVKDLSAAIPDLGDLSQLLAPKHQAVGYSGTTAELIWEFLERMRRGRAVARFAQLLQLFQVLLAAPESDKEYFQTGDPRENVDSRDEHLSNLALEFIHDNLAEEIRLTDLAKHLSVSESTASRLLSRTSTQGFSGVLTRLRIIEACRLLAETDEKIGDISHLVGFRNLSNFNRRFLQETGMTPSAYRKSLAQ